MKKILHISPAEKFLASYIDFIKKYFNFKEHKFFLLDRKNKKEIYRVPHYENITIITSSYDFEVLKLFTEMNHADKIIIHGLWDGPLTQILYFQPWLIKKYYWVMWGGDFYYPEKQSKLKKNLIRKIKHFITYLEDDYTYVQKHYKANGIYHECIAYPSNIVKFEKKTIKEINRKKLNILVGNSATIENNHIEIFKKLLKYKHLVNIYVPLSYGNMKYKEYIIKEGRKYFGNNFYPLTKFIKLEDYLVFLSKMDIGIFAHNRQQAMGNIINLLGMGKKVFLRKYTSQWNLFNKLGVKVFDIADFSLELLPKDITEKNISIVRNFFSEENLRKQWENIFNY